MPHRLQSLALCLTISLLGACGAPQRGNDVWDSYDIRHPLPQEGYSHPYDQYIDNDNYYVAPSCSIIDSPGCAGD